VDMSTPVHPMATPLYIQGGPRKVKPTTILLVTFECVGRIQ